MSMSVCNAENFKMGFRFARRSPVAKVKKILFTEPDPEENKKFIDFHLQEEYNRGCLKWNFNFREETTLDPTGDYIWQPSSPILINRKRKPVEVIDDSRAYYFQPIEPVARSPENQPKIKVPKQKRITDYMPKTKRQVAYSKETAVERPKKIPKLSDCSS